MKNRDDIQFISLATDNQQELLSFLKTKEFKYAVVADKEKYMTEQLKISAYPTHILVDKNGKIVKVVNAIDDLDSALGRRKWKGVRFEDCSPINKRIQPYWLILPWILSSLLQK